jgi:integrase
MAGITQTAKLQSPTARAKLPRGRNAYWHPLVTGRVALGYQRAVGDETGRWIVRHYRGKAQSKNGKLTPRYRVEELGLADDRHEADGRDTLSFEQAKAKGHAQLLGPTRKRHRLTVTQAFEAYVAFKRAQGQPVGDVVGRAQTHILPVLGDYAVQDLTSEQLRSWLAALAASPALKRSKRGEQAYKALADTDEAVRRRRSSANRVLTMLKAMLNHAYDEGHVASNEAWGRRLKAFREVDVARVRYLTVAEAQRLLNGCDPDFRSLVQAGLTTGARYGELIRLEVVDFNPDSGTLAIRRSKSGKPRHVVLTDEGAAFFRQVTAGRAGNEVLFVRADGGAWLPSHQGRPMHEACIHAKIRPVISFHGLRHTWASHAVMNAVPLMVVSKNLGHADTRMVEKHYGHLAPSFITEAIRNGAPKFGFAPDSKVTTLKRR